MSLVKGPYTSPQKYWQNLISIVFRLRFPRNAHGIWRFFHAPHDFFRNSPNNCDIFCKRRNEPIDIKNIDKVTAYKSSVFNRMIIARQFPQSLPTSRLDCGAKTLKEQHLPIILPIGMVIQLRYN